MARVDPQQGLMPSILDRLIDPTLSSSEGRGYQVQQMMEVVRKDLEDLLNTRQSLSDAGRERERVRNSILGFGLPEITAMQVLTPQQRQEAAQVLEETVSRHEPRLQQVRVTLMDFEASKQPSLRFRIDARLTVEPAPEVAYDSVVEVSTGQHTVQHTGQAS